MKEVMINGFKYLWNADTRTLHDANDTKQFCEYRHLTSNERQQLSNYLNYGHS